MSNNVLKKYKSMSKVSKAAMWFAFATVLQKGVAFLTAPIFARIMTSEQYGLFNVYLSWTSVLTIVSTMEFHNCAYLNGIAKLESEDEKKEIAVSLLNLSFVITCVWIFIYFLLRKPINQVLRMPTKMIILMFSEILFIPAVNFWTVKQRYTYHYRILVLRTILQVVLNALLGIVFVLISAEEQQALARMTAIVIVQMLFGLCALVWFCASAKMFFSTKYWKKGLSLHLPLVPHQLSLTILSSADRIMIEYMVSATATAFYSVAYSATMVINIIKLSINDALTPWIYESIRTKNYQTIRKNTVPVMLLVMTMAFLFVLFAPEIIYIVGSKKYMDAIYVVPPVAASVFFTFLYNLFSSVEFYFEKTRTIMVASLGAAATNIILNLIFIPCFGYIAAGYTTLVCYVLLSLVHFINMKRTIKNEFEVREIFNIKAILFLSGIVFVSMAICLFLYFNRILRYLVIIGMLIMLILMRRRIMKLLKSIKTRKT